MKTARESIAYNDALLYVDDAINREDGLGSQNRTSFENKKKLAE